MGKDTTEESAEVRRARSDAIVEAARQRQERRIHRQHAVLKLLDAGAPYGEHAIAMTVREAEQVARRLSPNKEWRARVAEIESENVTLKMALRVATATIAAQKAEIVELQAESKRLPGTKPVSKRTA